MTGDTRAAARGAPRFKPYPKYKEAAVEWLGQIPAGWEVKNSLGSPNVWTAAARLECRRAWAHAARHECDPDSVP
jgi:hypothetical protein